MEKPSREGVPQRVAGLAPSPRPIPGRPPGPRVPPDRKQELYAANLLSLDLVPALYRYNAFPDSHLDSLENPANAGMASRSEGRAFVAPMWSPDSYGIAPQVTAVHPVGRGYVVGGGFSAAPQSSTGYSSLSALLARHFGRANIGVSVDRATLSTKSPNEVPGAGSDSEQTRFTLGVATQLAPQTHLSLYARYGWAEASIGPAQQSGRTTDIGFRLRTAVTPKLSYFLAGNLGTYALRAGTMSQGSLPQESAMRLIQAPCSLWTRRLEDRWAIPGSPPCMPSSSARSPDACTLREVCITQGAPIPQDSLAAYGRPEFPR